MFSAALPFLLAVTAQAGNGDLRITSPEEGAYIVGTTELAAAASGGNVEHVTFFADGVMVCRDETPPYTCTWNAGATIREHSIRVVATFGRGERVVRTVRTSGAGHAEVVLVDAVPVTVIVTDGRGRFVSGLGQQDFRIYEDDRLQAISVAAAEAAPLEVVVAIDVSGSMEGAMPRVREAVGQFMATVPAHYPVSAIVFNDNVFTLVERSTDLDERARAAADLAAWGSTRLFDGILAGVDLLSAGGGRKALIVFTDGDDVASRTRLPDLEARLESSDVTLYTIGQGRGASLKELRDLLERLAERTGGRSFATEDPSQLQRAFAEIVDELSHQYLLSYEPTNTKRDGSWRRIKVELVPRGYRVRARQGYRAPGR